MSNRVRFADRLLAEAVASGERREGRARRDALAEARAIAEVTDFESRIAARAAALPDAHSLRDATQRVSRVVGLVIAVALFLSALAGAAAGRTALASPREPVNIFLVLLALLGVQTVLLAAWMIVFVAGRRLLRRGSLGGLLYRTGQAVARRMLRQPTHLDAIEAAGRLTLGTRYGSWLISGVSHQFWALFNVGCLMVIVVMLSTNQYTFVWETTTRTEDQYIALTRSIAKWPEQLGFITPSKEQIRISRLNDGAPPPVATQGGAPGAQGLQLAWSGMLVGCIVTYGLLPRALLAMICMLGGMAARQRVRLNVHAPEFAVLRPILMPAAARLPATPAQPADDAAPLPARTDAETSPPTNRPIGDPAIAGIEIELPAASWPPAVHGMTWDDHGFIDTGAARRAFIESLRVSHTRPHSIVLVCDLTSTPDRGVQSFLREIHDASRSPITIVLTGGQRLRERSVAVDIDQRIQDWRTLITDAHAGVDTTVEVDLDHLTDQSAALLRKLALGEPRADRHVDPASASRFAEAIAVISNHAAKWSADPTEAEVLDLHRGIQTLYGSRSSAGVARFLLGRVAALSDRVPAAEEIEDSIRGGVSAVLTRLPERLKSQPKWIVAGAAAGAFGCLAVTLGAVPAAIGALPAWTALGAAVSAGIRMALPDRENASEAIHQGAVTRAGAVRSAALFAAILDLQGRSESDITRLLDQTFDESSISEFALPENDTAASEWLRHIRDRFERALSGVNDR